MTERLSIRKFGPIQEADIEVRDLTIFVGPQATGKSLAAQLLCFLSGVEDTLLGPSGVSAMIRNPDWHTWDIEKIAEMALEWWLGEKPKTYTDKGAEISLNLSDKQYSLAWNGGLSIGSDFATRIKGYLLGVEEATHPLLDQSQIYIPAGRSLYSYLPPAQALLVIREQKFPGHILKFYSILEQAIREVAKARKSDLQADPLIKSSQTRIKQVMKGDLRYETQGNVLLNIKDKAFSPQSFAAGQMEIWPFFATLQSQVLAGKISKTRFYIEEPEAHLHPGAQLKVLEIIASAVQRGAKVLITTHSPFILYAINNFLTAGEVLASGQSLPSGVAEDTALTPDRVAAYRFTPRGTVRNILDRKAGLIDSTELNSLAEDLGTRFSEMQSQLLVGAVTK